MALDFTLEQLLNPTQELGGAPGAGDAGAIAKLIMGGGSASLEGQQLFGQPISGSTASAKPALSNSLKVVLDSADQIAGSLGSPNASGVVRKTLLPNPYGPGSYDPNDQAQVAGVKEQAAQAAKLDKARQTLQFAQSSPILAKNQGDIAKAVLQSLGVVPTAEKEAFDKAKGTAEGQLAGGKGIKTAIDPALLQSIGKPEFEEKFAQLVADGKITDPAQQIALERLHQNRLTRSQVPDVDRRSLTDLRGSHKLIGDLGKAYEETPAAKSGKVSESLKLSLNSNAKIATLSEAQLIDGTKLDPQERKFVARYNSLLLGLRRLSGDPRFSDQDAVRALTALGNPSVGPDLYREQIKALQDDIGTRYETAREDLKSVGKNVDALQSINGGGKVAAGTKLDTATALRFKELAGGDKDKARQLAREAGYSF